MDDEVAGRGGCLVGAGGVLVVGAALVGLVGTPIALQIDAGMTRGGSDAWGVALVGGPGLLAAVGAGIGVAVAITSVARGRGAVRVVGGLVALGGVGVGLLAAGWVLFLAGLGLLASFAWH